MAVDANLNVFSLEIPKTNQILVCVTIEMIFDLVTTVFESLLHTFKPRWMKNKVMDYYIHLYSYMTGMSHQINHDHF